MNIKRIGAVCAMLTALSACVIGAPRGYVNAEAWGANYTEDYIREFAIETADGQETQLEGVQVKPFSKGGTGGVECCSPIPGVGQMIRIVWRIGEYNEPLELWETYSKAVRVTGIISKGADTQSALIVRFFPGHEIEAEFVPMDRGARANSRDDQLFYGRPVMRQMGE
jgi:hypothetical protein